MTQNDPTSQQAAGAEPHGAEPEETDWEAKYREALANSRKWEQRSKENAKAAKELDEIKAAQMTETERLQKQLADAQAEADALKAEKARAGWVAKVAKETGVPESILSRMSAASEDELTEAARAVAADLPKPAVVVPRDGEQPKDPQASAREQFAAAMEAFN